MEESDIFNVKFNESGRRKIARFASISIFILVLVILQASATLYWDVKALTLASSDYGSSWNYKAASIISFIVTVASVVSNVYYIRFPRKLHRALQLNDEYGANKAFSAMLASGWIYLFSLILMLINFSLIVLVH